MSEYMGANIIDLNFCFPDKKSIGGLYVYSLMQDEK